MMRADTQAISIDAAPDKVFAFLSNPENLPRWAVGFAKSVRRNDDRWIVTTGAGEVGMRIDADPKTGAVDYRMSPALDVELYAGSRVLPRGERAEYVFTQYQWPGIDDEAFEKSVQTLRHELTVLKALLEVECPL